MPTDGSNRSSPTTQTRDWLRPSTPSQPAVSAFDTPGWQRGASPDSAPAPSGPLPSFEEGCDGPHETQRGAPQSRGDQDSAPLHSACSLAGAKHDQDASPSLPEAAPPAPRASVAEMLERLLGRVTVGTEGRQDDEEEEEEPESPLFVPRDRISVLVYQRVVPSFVHPTALSRAIRAALAGHPPQVPPPIANAWQLAPLRRQQRRGLARESSRHRHRRRHHHPRR